jgi:hypothetical protein
MPFMMLAIIDGLDYIKHRFVRIILSCSGAAIVALPLLFNWEAWTPTTLRSLSSHYLVSAKNLIQFRNRFTYRNIPLANSISAYSGELSNAKIDEAVTLMSLIRSRNESFIVIDSNYSLHPNDNFGTWTAIHSPANYTFVGRDERKSVIRTIANRFAKTGWVLIDKDLLVEWIADFDISYTRTGFIDGFHYQAIRFSPNSIKID